MEVSKVPKSKTTREAPVEIVPKPIIRKLVILGTLPPSWYFIHGNYIYRVLERTKEFYCKGARKITHVYVNTVMYKDIDHNRWHEVKSRDIEEMDIMLLVEPCLIGPIFISGE